MIVRALATLLTKRIEKSGAPYYTFGIFGILNYIPTYYYHTITLPDIYENLPLRVIATLLCLGLVTHKQWPQKLKPYLSLYWYSTLLFSLPFFGAYMLLCNHFTFAWLINGVMGLFLLVLLVDWLMFMLLVTLGGVLGITLYYGMGDIITSSVPPALLLQGLETYIFALIVGGIFSRNKETTLHQKLTEAYSQEVRELRSTLHSAEQALDAKESFFTKLSHEIRTPIHGIVAITSALKEDWEGLASEERFTYFTKVARGAERLHALVTNLFDLFRVAKGKLDYHLHHYNLVEVAQQVREECALISPSSSILISSIPSSPFACFDKLRIEQVLRNILINALTHGEGTIRIDIKESILPTAHHGTRAALTCSISDEGPGIPQEEIEKIFEPMIQGTRAKHDAKGIGLGLSICREIITAHHGEIGAYNNSSKGATFYFTLPVAP